jgi:hypothetical protein
MRSKFEQKKEIYELFFLGSQENLIKRKLVNECSIQIIVLEVCDSFECLQL